MSTTARAPRPSAGARSGAVAAKPVGLRRPNPGLIWLCIRIGAFVSMLLAVARPFALDWAAAQPAPLPPTSEFTAPYQAAYTADSRSTFPLDFDIPDADAIGLVQIIGWTYGNVWFSKTIRLIGYISLVLIAAELVLNLYWAVRQPRRMRQVPTTFIRVRAPAPPATQTGRPAASAKATGDQFFRAIQKEVISFQWLERFSGHAPWVAFTLTGIPDDPVELGIVVASRSPKERRDMEMAIRTIIQGQAPGSQIEVYDDLLGQALAPGVTVAWREYGLKLPGQYPIRYLEDIEGSDLLAPLAAALAPHGTLRTEAQIILRPANDWRLKAGWRGHTTGMMLALKGNEDYALSEDVKTLEAKLDAAPFEAWLRIVAVADGAGAEAAAIGALDQIGKVLGQYSQRTSHHLQHFVQRGTSVAVIPTDEEALRPLALGMRLRSVGSQFAAPFRRGWHAILRRLGTDDSLSSRAAALSLDSAGAQRARAMLLTRAPRFTPAPPLGMPIALFRSADPLTSIEIAGLWHLPTPALAHHVRWLPNKFVPAEPHAYVPECYNELHGGGGTLADGTPKNPRVIVGLSRRADGTVAPVGPTLRDLRQILHLTAGMGTGKSRLLANICKQLIPNGYILLDGKGDDRAGNLVMTMRQHIPLADEGRVVILDVLDTEWPFGLNPMAGIDLSMPGGVDQGLAQLLSVFARIDPETWGKSQGMQQYAKMAALLVLEAEKHPTLAHVKQALLDEGYRKRLLPVCNNQDVVAFWTVIYPQTGDQQKQSRDALLRRFDALLATETTRYMVTQPNPTLSLLHAIERGMIVLVPMPEMTLGDLAGTIGMIVFQAVVRAAMGRAGNDQSRATYAMVIDEFQVFVGNGDTSDVRKALTQVRSLGIAGIYAHQSLTQLGELVDEMMTNAASRIILKTQEPDASTYARQYAASGLTAADIAGQDPNEHQYAVLMAGGKPTKIFSMQTLPWPAVEALEVRAPTEQRNWQEVIPAGSRSPKFDRYVAKKVHGKHVNFQLEVDGLAANTDADWAMFLERWAAIREAQRAYILAYPGCIPDRLERQRWLSRLLACTPRIIAAAEYARIRKAIEPDEGTAPAAGKGGKPPQPGDRTTTMPRTEDPADVGRIEGITPASAPPALQAPRPGLKTAEEVDAERARRRSSQDVAPEFRDLPEP
ncbi:MAG TPA: ATP-binding protein [Roseiflexaceae bacterium]|nr:ATP-binding protein [Roseiflexaceae bacterium]